MFYALRVYNHHLTMNAQIGNIYRTMAEVDTPCRDCCASIKHYTPAGAVCLSGRWKMPQICSLAE